MALPFKFTTAASTNLTPVGNDFAKVYSVTYVCGATAAYLKFYWTNGAVTVGTTVPNLTVGLTASTNTTYNFGDAMGGNGRLWLAVTAAAADGDSANAASGIIVTLNVG